MTTQLSPHFTLEDLIVTDQKGVDNTPTGTEAQNLRRLAVELLEPLYERVGPFRVISAYRSPALNAKLAGSNAQVSSTSYHMQGIAADIVPLSSLGVRPYLAKMIQSGIPFGEAFVKNTALHVSLPTATKRNVAGEVVNNKYFSFDAEELKKFLAENAGSIAGIGGIAAVGALIYLLKG